MSVLSELLVLSELFISSHWNVMSSLVFKEFASPQYLVKSKLSPMPVCPRSTLISLDLVLNKLYVSLKGLLFTKPRWRADEEEEMNDGSMIRNSVWSQKVLLVVNKQRRCWHTRCVNLNCPSSHFWSVCDPEFCLIAESVIGGEQAVPLLPHSVYKLQVSQFASHVSLWVVIIYFSCLTSVFFSSSAQ